MEFKDYKKLSLANDIVILTATDKPEDDKRKVPEKTLQILLIKRYEEPYNEFWSLPGGFVDHDKNLDDCAREKLYAKTGIKNLYIEQLYTYGDTNRDERGRVVSVAYLALVKKSDINIQISQKTDSSSASWFSIEPIRKADEIVDVSLISEDGHLIVKDLAFDHKQMIIDALNRLQNKIEYTDLAFNLVPEFFTVKELQMVYECILGRTIQAFRRKISDKIKPADKMKDDGSAYRPAQLYRFDNKHSKF